MNPKERQEMLARYSAANVWLTRVYNTNRSREHRLGLWNFLMDASPPQLKNILVYTRQMDEDAVMYWDTFGKN